eukprot:COSAG01_NODE_7647_length_3115_cov_1.557692_6_plen_99_part_00
MPLSWMLRVGDGGRYPAYVAAVRHGVSATGQEQPSLERSACAGISVCYPEDAQWNEWTEDLRCVVCHALDSACCLDCTPAPHPPEFVCLFGVCLCLCS